LKQNIQTLNVDIIVADVQFMQAGNLIKFEQLLKPIISHILITLDIQFVQRTHELRLHDKSNALV